MSSLETYPNNYVLGFLFDQEKEHVLLIEKQSPAWQKGKLNGIGGKIKPEETTWNAMVREFKEETDLYVSDWMFLGKLHGANTDDDKTGFCVWLYETVLTLDQLYSAKSTTNERVMVFPVKDIPYKACIPNLSWIIPFCLYPYNTQLEVKYFD